MTPQASARVPLGPVKKTVCPASYIPHIYDMYRGRQSDRATEGRGGVRSCMHPSVVVHQIKDVKSSEGMTFGLHTVALVLWVSAVCLRCEFLHRTCAA